MSLELLLIFIIISIVLFKLKKHIQINILKNNVNTLLIVIALITIIVCIQNNRIQNIKINLQSLIPAIGILVTFLTYRDGIFQTYKRDTNKKDIDTFFNILNIIIDKGSNISANEVTDFRLDVINEFNVRNALDIHKSFCLMEFFKNNENKINNIISGLDITIVEKVNKLIESDNKEDFLKFINSNGISQKIGLYLQSEKRKPYFNKKEVFMLEKSGLFGIIKNYFQQNNPEGMSIRYQHVYDIINRKMDNPKYQHSDYFRLYNRAIKIIKESNLEDKNNYYKILRSITPDFLMDFLYYHVTFTKSGIGLGYLLSDIKFFGTDSDFEVGSNGIAKFAQHIDLRLLIFKKQDILLMMNVYGKKTKSISEDEFIEDLATTFNNNNMRFSISYFHKV